MMTNDSSPLDPAAHGCLVGAKCWLITGGKAGMITQAKGIADALGVESILKNVAPRGIWRILAPWGPVSPMERFGKPGSRFAKPWPDIAIAVGRASIPYIRRLRRETGLGCYTIVLQDPRSGPDTADLIWVPEHDTRRGPNVITTMISPHGYSLAHLETLRRHSAPDIDRLPPPLVAIILGGPNAVYKFSEPDINRLAGAIRSIARLGVSFLVTASRRTPPRLLEAVRRATADAPRIVWSSEENGPNPYADFLARADWFVVTADSVNMTGEVCATGRPVYVFHPSGGSAKFARYHKSLEALGATRPLPDDVDELAKWSYQPQVSAAAIARETEHPYHRRRQMLAAPSAPETPPSPEP